jgi:putative flippase GtrA
MSLVGEGKMADERESLHRYYSNRAALVGGTVLLSIGVLYQLFTHHLDYWLLAGLIVINLVKIVSLIYLDYKK